MDKKWIRIGNGFYNLDKAISVESDHLNNKLKLIFDGGVETIIECKDSVEFLTFIFKPISQALEGSFLTGSLTNKL